MARFNGGRSIRQKGWELSRRNPRESPAGQTGGGKVTWRNGEKMSDRPGRWPGREPRQWTAPRAAVHLPKENVGQVARIRADNAPQSMAPGDPACDVMWK